MIRISTFSAIISSIISQPFEFLKTKVQIYNEGIGIRGIRMNQGFNSSKIFQDLHMAGYGTKVLYTGLNKKY